MGVSIGLDVATANASVAVGMSACVPAPVISDRVDFETPEGTRHVHNVPRFFWLPRVDEDQILIVLGCRVSDCDQADRASFREVEQELQRHGCAASRTWLAMTPDDLH